MWSGFFLGEYGLRLSVAGHLSARLAYLRVLAIQLELEMGGPACCMFLLAADSQEAATWWKVMRRVCHS